MKPFTTLPYIKECDLEYNRKMCIDIEILSLLRLKEQDCFILICWLSIYKPLGRNEGDVKGQCHDFGVMPYNPLPPRPLVIIY